MVERLEMWRGGCGGGAYLGEKGVEEGGAMDAGERCVGGQREMGGGGGLQGGGARRRPSPQWQGKRRLHCGST